MALDEKHAEMFGKLMQDTGVININKDEYLHFGLLVEKLYQYCVKENERDSRDVANGKSA